MWILNVIIIAAIVVLVALAGFVITLMIIYNSYGGKPDDKLTQEQIDEILKRT
jgi:multisubunit Na+/H+ antiporter MnhC subunit|tara:strand:- start:25 stop:183 length:159 start_codon:yes stop_codon:yes gene_type:complete